MSRHQRRNRRHHDTRLSHVIDTAMDGILLKLDAEFDAGAGLADIRARAEAARRVHSSSPAPPASATDSSSVAAACHQIELLTDWLTDLVTAGQQSPFAGAAYIELARDRLIELRAELTGRSIDRPEAQRYLSEIQDQLGQADSILRSQLGTTLDHLAASSPGHDDTLTGQLHATAQTVIRLYAPDGHDQSLVPAR
jgi:hypothetical protein